MERTLEQVLLGNGELLLLGVRRELDNIRYFESADGIAPASAAVTSHRTEARSKGASRYASLNADRRRGSQDSQQHLDIIPRRPGPPPRG